MTHFWCAWQPHADSGARDGTISSASPPPPRRPMCSLYAYLSFSCLPEVLENGFNHLTMRSLFLLVLILLALQLFPANLPVVQAAAACTGTEASLAACPSDDSAIRECTVTGGQPTGTPVATDGTALACATAAASAAPTATVSAMPRAYEPPRRSLRDANSSS